MSLFGLFRKKEKTPPMDKTSFLKLLAKTAAMAALAAVLQQVSTLGIGHTPLAALPLPAQLGLSAVLPTLAAWLTPSPIKK